MYRKELAEFLLDNPMSVHELAPAMGQKVRAVAEDLEHLRRSLHHGPGTFEVEPAACNQCGFVFRADKLTRPGRCPRCRGTWIRPPRVVVRRGRSAGG